MTPALALLMLSAIPVPQPVNNPAEWIMTNDYPSAALRAEATGIVGFRLLIDPQGAVSDCAIIQSSGMPIWTKQRAGWLGSAPGFCLRATKRVRG
jgi:hypothetical protein